ncbi:MAG: hypothetical protein AB2A00_03265 [Myxococcota bacterium]
MRGVFLATTLVLGCVPTTQGRDTTGGTDERQPAGTIYRLHFDSSSPGVLPADGELIIILGGWAIDDELGAPSAPNVLRQTEARYPDEYPRAVVRDRVFEKLSLKAKCRIDAGETHPACGLMFRFQDSRNYMVAWMGVPEQEVHLVLVKDGVREEMARSVATVQVGRWHDLEVRATPLETVIKLDGQTVLSNNNSSFVRGKVGVWSESDTTVSFDDFEARELE